MKLELEARLSIFITKDKLDCGWENRWGEWMLIYYYSVCDERILGAETFRGFNQNSLYSSTKESARILSKRCFLYCSARALVLEAQSLGRILDLGERSSFAGADQYTVEDGAGTPPLL